MSSCGIHVEERARASGDQSFCTRELPKLVLIPCFPPMRPSAQFRTYPGSTCTVRGNSATCNKVEMMPGRDSTMVNPDSWAKSAPYLDRIGRPPWQPAPTISRDCKGTFPSSPRVHRAVGSRSGPSRLFPPTDNPSLTPMSVEGLASPDCKFLQSWRRLLGAKVQCWKEPEDQKSLIAERRAPRGAT